MATARQAKTSIVWVLSGDESFGVRRALLNLSREVRRRGAQVAFVLIGDGEIAPELRASGASVDVMDLPGAPAVTSRGGVRMVRQLVRLAVEAPTLAWRLSRVQALRDASHVQVMWPNLVLPVALAAAMTHSTCIWEMVNVLGPGRLRPFLYRQTCRLLRVQPVANSHYVARSLTSRARSPFHVPVMHLSADPVFAEVESLSPAPPKVAVCLARLETAKAQDALVRACARPSLRELHLRLVGAATEPGFGESLLRLVAELSLSERVQVLGPTDDPAAELAAAGMAVSLNRVVEAFGLSVVEAMMAGRPVLATATGGPGETIEDGRTGWLIEAATDESVVAGLERALDQWEEWPKLGLEARRKAERDFSVEAQGDRYFHILEGIGQR